jgi:hypothetical protein
MALLTNINNLFSVDSTGAIEFSTQVGATGYVLESRGAGNAPVWTDRDTGGVIGTGTENKVVRWNAAPATGDSQTIGDGPITFSGSAATANSTFGGNVSCSNLTASVRLFSGDGGNKTNPMIANGSDEDTGIFFPAANTMAFTAGDTEAFRIAGANSTFAGSITVSGISSTLNTGNSGSFVTNDTNNYPRISTASANIQLGLFRTTTGPGGVYMGGFSGGFEVRNGSTLAPIFNVDQSGNGDFAGSALLDGLASDGYRIYKIRLQAPYTGGWGSITPGTVIGGLQQTNYRTDGGASNIAAAVDFELENNTYGTGQTRISFKCGGVNGVDSTEKMRIQSDGNTIFTGRIGAETTLTPLWSVQTGTSAVTIPNARYLNFYTGEINYANFSRGFMCSISDDTAVNQPKQIGLIMHNNSKVNNTFSPGIVFGSQANSGSYSDATAMIAARRNGQSGDANWSSGQLWFWTATAGATISTSSPDRGLPDGFPAMVINEYRRVMIGTNIAATTGQPVISQALQVATGNSNDGIIIHGNGSDDGMTSGAFRKIGFRYDETDQSFESEIRFVVTDSTNHGGQLEFWTDSTNGTTTRAMTINKLQYVGIGANSPAEKLHVSGGNIRLDSTVAGGNGILMIYDSSGTQSGQIYGSSSDLKIYSPVDVLFNQGGNVGIGNTSPGTKLHVSSTGTSTRFESSGSYSDIQFVSTAGMNFVNFGSANEFLLYQGGGSGANITTKIDTSGNATFKGDVVAYGSPSDIRLKENIKPIKSALDKVSKLNGVTFDWKEKTEHLDKKGNPINLQQWKHDVGFIAQDVQKVVPELVRENDNGMLSMRHQGIAPILLEAIKELKAEIEELKSNKCNCNK